MRHPLVAFAPGIGTPNICSATRQKRKGPGGQPPAVWPAPASCFRSTLAGAGRDLTAGAPGPSGSTVSGQRKLRPVEQQVGAGVSFGNVPAQQPALAEPAVTR